MTTYYINTLDSNTWTSVFSLRCNEYCVAPIGNKFGLIYRASQWNGFVFKPVTLQTISTTREFTLIACEANDNVEKALPNSISSQTRCYRVLTRTQYDELFAKTVQIFKSGRTHFTAEPQSRRNCPPARL